MKAIAAGVVCLWMSLLAFAEPPKAALSGRPEVPALNLEPPIERWDDGLPMGNGLAGTLIWGGGNTLRLSLDRGDLWDTREPEIFSSPDWTYANMLRLKNERNHAEHQRLFDVPYDTIPYPTKLPVGRLEIVLPTGSRLDGFSLDLDRNEATAGLQHTPTSWRQLRVYMDEDEPTMVVRGVPEGTTLTLVPPGGVSKLGYPPATMGHGDSSVSTTIGGDTRINEYKEVWFVQPIKTRTGEGRFAIAAAMCTSAPAHKGQPFIRAVAVTIVHDADLAPGEDLLKVARTRAQNAADVYRVKPGHKTGPNAAYPRRHFDAFTASRVSLPDEELQAQYDISKHLMIAGSRPGMPPIALQGVWTADEGGLPPWKGDYHNNLNTQMTYLPCVQAGLFDQGRAWLDFNVRLTPEYTRFARGFYGVDGLVVPGVMTIEGRPMGGWGQYAMSPTHSAWIAHQFYMQWRYTRDRERLEREWYPFVAGVARALSQIVREEGATADTPGRYVLPLSTSPEINDNSYEAWLTPNSSYDDAMLRFAFASAMELAAELGRADEAAAWKAHLDRCTPLPQEDAGALPFAKGFPYNQSHRHFSHAIAIYPLGLLTPDRSPRVIGATLDEIDRMGTRLWTGYSFAWMSAMAARAGQAERAADYLRKYISFTGRNGFHLNGDQSGTGLSSLVYRPFTLEGNMIAMQAVHEMLLQSWGEVGSSTPSPSHVLRIFPATPRQWSWVSFENLRAEGGLSVSAKRECGTMTYARVQATQATDVRIADTFVGTRTFSREPDEIRKGGPGDVPILFFRLGAGEIVEIRAKR